MTVCAGSRCTKKVTGRAIFCPECRKKTARPSSDPTRARMTKPAWVQDFLARTKVNPPPRP